MTELKYIRHKILSLKNHPELNEKWVQNIINEDPSILGLGELIPRDKERPQPHAGRLDLLLQDADQTKRYEVEIQLGHTDESHIIRTIEYWDIERKRFPQYDHCAVMIAEGITSRFLNVISLFNGYIPIIALQMSAVQMDDKISLVFTKVLDELSLGLSYEDEALTEIADRPYWEDKATKTTVRLVDELLDIIHTFEPRLELKYNKFYIGLAKNGQPNNFVIFRPKKKFVRFEIRLPQEEEIENKIQESGLDYMSYNIRNSRFIIKLNKTDLAKHRDILIDLMKASYEKTNE